MSIDRAAWHHGPQAYSRVMPAVPLGYGLRSADQRDKEIGGALPSGPRPCFRGCSKKKKPDSCLELLGALFDHPAFQEVRSNVHQHTASRARISAADLPRGREATSLPTRSARGFYRTLRRALARSVREWRKSKRLPPQPRPESTNWTRLAGSFAVHGRARASLAIYPVDPRPPAASSRHLRPHWTWSSQRSRRCVPLRPSSPHEDWPAAEITSRKT